MADNKPEVRRPEHAAPDRGTDSDTKSETKSDTKPAGNLAPASESGDPVVHKLLAERQGHEQNAEEPPDLKAVRKTAAKAIDDIDEKLAKLGYTAK